MGTRGGNSTSVKIINRDGFDLVSEREIDSKFKKENITYQKVELYHQFLIKLSIYLHKSYFGRKHLVSDNDIMGHFNWGYNKVCDDLHIFNMNFKENVILNGFLYVYYVTSIYENEKWQEDSIIKDQIYYNNVMSYNHDKNYYDLETMIDLYKIFDESDRRTPKKI